MADQLSFASLDFAAKKKRTKRDVFLAEMAAVVPWAKLEALIEPHYPRLAHREGVGHFRSRRCCASTACSNGTTCPIPAPRKRSTIAERDGRTACRGDIGRSRTLCDLIKGPRKHFAVMFRAGERCRASSRKLPRVIGALTVAEQVRLSVDFPHKSTAGKRCGNLSYTPFTS
jgi:hypothetical protein